MNLPVPDPNESSEVVTMGPARYRRVNGLHVLRLAGTDYEMGRQHGALLSQMVPLGPIPYYRTYVERIVGGNRGVSAVAALVQRLVGRRVRRAIPAHALEAMLGLADGAGLPREEILEGCTMPDSLLWAAAKMMKVRRIAPAVQHRLALGLGCSSAIAWGSATVDGKLLHARNLDYHGVEAWPRTSAVVFHEPDRGQRYVALSAAGVLLGGVTAMNEAGLTLAVHQHMFSDGTRLGGTPIGIVGDEIMRHATSLDEARAILEANRPIGCWTYLICDGKRQEVLCWEENPRHRRAQRIRREEETFSYANIYFDPDLGATERDLYGSYWRANLGRQLRLRELLGARSEPLSADGMAAILGDTGGTSCRLHKPIAMLMTVASVVFRPEDGVFWVATGEAPTSQNRFEPFSLERQDHAPDLGALTGGAPSDRDEARAFDAYRRAYLAYFDRGDLAGSRKLVDEAVALQPAQPLYLFLAGLLAVAAGEADVAWRSFDRALCAGHPDAERVASFHLWRGRAADLMNRRAQARRDYERALGYPADTPVERAAKRGLRRPFPAWRASRIDVDFAFADVVDP